MSEKIIDALVIALIIVLSFLLVLIYNINSLLFAILVLGLPSVYLLVRIRKAMNTVKNIIVFSLLSSAALVIVFYLANVYSVWFVPSQIGFRILNSVSVEEAFFAVFWLMEILLVYERFFANNTTKVLRYKFMVRGVLLFWLVFLFGLFLGFFDMIKPPYPYTILVLVFGVPPLLFFKNKENYVIVNLLKVGSIFFVVHFIWELIGVRYNMWTWNGSYIGLVDMFGLSFPFEEFIIWIVLGAPIVCLIYENFLIKRHK